MSASPQWNRDRPRRRTACEQTPTSLRPAERSTTGRDIEPNDHGLGRSRGGLATAAAAWYASAAGVINTTFGRTVVPVSPRTTR